MATCEFTIAALHHFSCFASMTLPYFMYFMKFALEFGKVRIILLEMLFKSKQSIFPHQQPLHVLILTFRSNYEAYCHSLSTGTIDLHIDSARITGSCSSSCVTLVVPVDLHNPSVRSSECKHVMACNVLDNHWYLSIATLPDVFNRLTDAVAPLITHSIINSLEIMFSQNSLFHSHT